MEATKAAPGDRLIIQGHRVGEPKRDAEILEVRGADGEPPYLIRWGDTGHVVLFFPGADAEIQHFGTSPPVPSEPGTGPHMQPLVPTEVVLQRAEIDARRRRPFEGIEGVSHVTLWHEADDYAGMLWIARDAGIPTHRHELASHHVWVVEGVAAVQGQDLESGSYWYVPPGASHAVHGAGQNGCKLFYLHIRMLHGGSPSRGQ